MPQPSAPKQKRTAIRSKVKAAYNKVKKEKGVKEANRQTKAFSNAVKQHTTAKKLKRHKKNMGKKGGYA